MVGEEEQAMKRWLMRTAWVDGWRLGWRGLLSPWMKQRYGWSRDVD
jgi:hypothetical protein